MKIKKLLALVLSLCMVLGLWACAESEPATETTQAPTEATGESQITPLVYEVTDDSGNTAWLFGSVHAGRDDFYPLPDYVYDAYNEADAAAFEANVLAVESDMAAQMELTQLMSYTDGTTIKDHLSEENYTKAVELLTAAGYYMAPLDLYNVPMWQMLLDQLLYEDLGIDLLSGIDRHLMQRAYDENKPIYEVESVRFQYQMLMDFSPALQEMLLETSIASWDDPEAVQAGLNDLMDCWASGNEADMVAILATESEGLTGEDLELYEEYNKAMVTDRNIGMADYAEAALASGEKVFICVGAAHIVGEGGVADLLAQRGYTVTAIGGTPAEN